MGNWSWEGIDKTGHRKTGVVEASNEREVRAVLRGLGVRPRRISPPSILEFDISEWMVEKGYSAPFGQRELCMFTKSLSTMTDAGIPILQSLEILYQQEKHPVLKKTIKNIHTQVGEGKTLADAMSQEKGFGKLYCNLVRAGELGGIMDKILAKLAEHMERQAKTKKQIKSAMTYPIIVVVIGIVVVWGLITFIVPQFSDMLKDTGQELPAITKFVVDLSAFMQEYTIYMIPGFFLFVFLLKSWVKTDQGKRIYDVISMKMPIFGGIVVKGNLSSFTRTMSTMLSSGINMIDALETCIDTIDNSVISDDLRVIKKAVTEGKTLSEPLGRIEYFPPMVTQMVRIGEQTGSLDQMLEKVSAIFEEEVNDLVANMTKMIEPIILVGLGGMVGAILIAMYLPIFMSAGGAG